MEIHLRTKWRCQRRIQQHHRPPTRLSIPAKMGRRRFQMRSWNFAAWSTFRRGKTRKLGAWPATRTTMENITQCIVMELGTKWSMFVSVIDDPHLIQKCFIHFRKAINLYCPTDVTHLKCCGKVFKLSDLKTHVSQKHEAGQSNRTEPSISPAWMIFRSFACRPSIGKKTILFSLNKRDIRRQIPWLTGGPLRVLSLCTYYLQILNSKLFQVSKKQFIIVITFLVRNF